MRKIIIKSPETEQDFKQYYALRWRVLRKPWHQAKGSEQDKDESSSCHFIAVKNNTILGVARLQNISPGEAQLRYMAVDTKSSRQGIGKKIIQAIESHADKNNIHYIKLHARENAVGFYKKMGYEVTEKSYLLFDCIQHYKMKKTLRAAL